MFYKIKLNRAGSETKTTTIDFSRNSHNKNKAPTQTRGSFVFLFHFFHNHCSKSTSSFFLTKLPSLSIIIVYIETDIYHDGDYYPCHVVYATIGFIVAEI